MKVASVLQKSFTGLLTQERVQFANSQPNRTFLTRSVVGPQKNTGVSLNRTRPTTLANTFAQTFPHLKNIRSFSTDDDSHPDFRAIRKNYENKGRTKEEVQEYIKKEVESNPLVVFMKGSPDMPRCGFSKLVVEILKEEGVKNIKGVDVLSDEQIRAGIKEYTQWPTIPQVFINKEFIGGSDIMKNLFETGELTKMLQTAKLIP